MNLVSALLRLVTLFALAGMLTAPVSTSAAEIAMVDMTAAATVDAMAGMPDDMSCCPDEQPVKSGCDQSCPLVIICSTPAPLAVLKASWTSAALAWAPLEYDSERLDRLHSLEEEPPARPPKA
ncbi:hypothetical protein [Shinella sp.]|jgi:hypothetical protein|uniref:hypothetical protein n=1 Tax=Shinella sp. TaxID=1870904 RepID=UPI003F711E3C